MTLSAYRVTEMPTGCHVWLGAVQSNGYGSVTDHAGGTMLAHRQAWESERGPIPDGLTIDHLCFNRRCVNPEHMELVTADENRARAARMKLYCPRGHEYTEANTARNSAGHRYCRECANEARRTKRASPWMSPGETARVLGISPTTLERWDAKGLITSMRTAGNHRRYRVAEIEALLHQCQTGTDPA